MELRKYWAVFWKRRLLFFRIAGGIVLLTLVLAFSATQVYKATTKVLIRTQDPSSSITSVVPSSLGKLDYTSVDNIGGTIRAVISSTATLNGVIEDLKLRKKNGTPFSTPELLKSGIIDLYLNKTAVKISQISDSDVVEIMGFSSDPAMAVKISGSLTSKFLEMMANLNREEIGRTIDILTKETLRLKNIVEDSEDTLRQYKINNKAINMDEKATTYTSQLVTTELSLVKMSIEKKEEHPDVRAALEQIAAIRNELKDIPTKQIELSRLQRINTAVLGVYTSLLSDLEKAKVLKAMSITNMRVIEAAQIPPADKKRYIYFPRKKFMLLLALIMGSVLGVVAVFFAEYIDDTIKSTQELKAWTGQKVLADIPLLKDGKLFPPKESSTAFSAVSDLWLSIRIDAKNRGNDKHPGMLTITSYGEKEGKSLIVSNLGLLLSKNGLKTLIIDFNLADPFLSTLYRRPAEKKETERGLADFIAAAKENNTDNAPAFRKLDDNLYFLPTGLTGPHNIPLIKNSPYLMDLLQAARKEFDVIIVDSSPLNKSREPLFIAKESDAAILVVEAGKYQLENIKWAIDDLNESGVFIAGAVLNKVS
ncbi:MAG: AAA family ATPase [Nitrospirae bacterium]|nr:AAA family ATPase [Nitrospirota bacterium]